MDLCPDSIAGMAQARSRVPGNRGSVPHRQAHRHGAGRESLRGHPPPSRKAGQGIAPTLSARTQGGGGLGTDFECDGGLIPEIARALTTSNQRIDAESETLLVAHSLRGEGFDASEDGTGRGTPLVPVAGTLTSYWHHSGGASAGNNPGLINPVCRRRPGPVSPTSCANDGCLDRTGRSCALLQRGLKILASNLDALSTRWRYFAFRNSH
ncbi:hypothetical protein OKW30_002172 [Paraburkholderia sp. Clong3]